MNSFPTEIVKLPSQGLVYPETNPLSKGELEIKYLTAYHEDILTNVNFVKQGIVLDKLLQALIVTKFNYDDLLVSDKEALLLAARILGYGKDYSFFVKNPVNGQIEKITVDLTQVKEKAIDVSKYVKGTNEFNFTLPNTNTLVTFKLLTLGDDKAIDKENEGLKKINPQMSHNITTTLKYMITSIEGNRDKKTIREFVDNNMLAIDRKEFSNYVKEITPGLDLKVMYDFGKGEEEVPIIINTDFFWPE